METMTTLDAFKLNPHVIYHSDSKRITCALNLLLFAEKQFYDSYIVQNIDKLRDICLAIDSPASKENLSGFINNGLMDGVKISICFENYSKAILLAKGYLIHNIDSQKFRLEAKKQKRKLILIEEFPGGLYIDNNIITEDDTVQQKYYGLKDTTELYSVVLNHPKYLEIMNIEEDLLGILLELNNSRNSLYLENSLSFNLKPTSYEEFMALFNFVESKISKNIKVLNDFLAEKNIMEDFSGKVASIIS